MQADVTDLKSPLLAPMLTGYLLNQLEGERRYAGFSSATAKARKVRTFNDQELEARAMGAHIGSSPLPFLR